MATTRAVSGSIQINNGGTILQAGATDGIVITSNLTLQNNAFFSLSQNQLAVSPVSSGNLGTDRPLGAGVFNSMEDAEWVASILGKRIAQTDDTFLSTGSSDAGQDRNQLHYARGNRRLDVIDISAFSGVVSKGGNEGDLVTYIDPATGNSQPFEPFPTNAITGEFVYLDGDIIPTQSDYSSRTNIG